MNLGTALMWAMRVAWVVVAVVGGTALEEGVDGRTSLAAWTTAIVGWSIWAVVAASMAIPAVRTLTFARVLAPLSLVATAVAAGAGASAMALLALGLPAAVAVLSLFSAEVGEAFAQASAYGDEERFMLRVPAAAGTAAVASWVVWAGVGTVAAITLAGGLWLAAVPAAIVFAGLCWFLLPRWHRLSRRWFVLVPAGLVIHDPVVLADTMMLRGPQIGGVALALADTGAADLTGPASGHAVEVQTTESITAVYAPTPSERAGKAIHLTAFLIAPSRPGRALAAAARRSLTPG